MCWSLAASGAALAAGGVACGSILWFVRDRIGESRLADGRAVFLDASDAQAAMTLASLLSLAVAVQWCDLQAHLRHRGWPSVPASVNGVMAYVIICAQPAALAAGTALLLTDDDDAVGRAVLWIVVAVVLGHMALCLALDAPLSAWTRVDVRKLAWAEERLDLTVCAVIYGFFSPAPAKGEGQRAESAFFGSAARVAVYFLGLTIGTGIFVFEGLDRAERPHAPDCLSSAEWCHAVGASMLVGILIAWAALAGAAMVGASTVRGHVGSLWCTLSLLAVYAAGVALLRGQASGWYARHALGVWGTWLVVFVAVSLCAPPMRR